MVAREDNATNWLDLTSPGRFLENINILESPWVGRLSTRSNQEVWSKAFQTAFPLFAHLEDLDANRVKLSEPESAPESNFFMNVSIPYTTDLIFDGNLVELHKDSEEEDKMIGVWEDYDIYLLRVKGKGNLIGQKLPKIPDDPRVSPHLNPINHWWAELVPVAQRRQSNQNMILFEYQLQGFATDIMNFSIFTGWGSTDVEIYRLRPRQLSTLNYPRGL